MDQPINLSFNSPEQPGDRPIPEFSEVSGDATLFQQFLDWVKTEPTRSQYLEGPPDEDIPFDPYQMVAEWIALKQEIKQQGKLLQSTQLSLQQALDTTQAEKQQLQERLDHLQATVPSSPTVEATERDQKRFLIQLLGIVDALDHACEPLSTPVEPEPFPPDPRPDWQRKLADRLQAWLGPPVPNTPVTPPVLSQCNEILSSHQAGIELIRRSLLELLRQRQVVPMNAVGQPFDPQCMYALGRQEAESFPENTVIQEVVRGYWWNDQILREAQVMVATPPKQA